MSVAGGRGDRRHRRRSLEARVAGVMAALPPRAQVLLSGSPPIEIDGQTLDPGVQLVLAAAARQQAPPFHQQSVGEARASFRHRVMLASGEAPSVHGVHELELEGAAGRLRGRHYAPSTPGEPAPLLVYLHGGGFVVGDLDTHDVACRLLCRTGHVHVLAVEYRKAPEHPFPAAVEDAQAALAYAAAHGAGIGAAPGRVAIGGDSSGGTLAAVATWLAVRDGRERPELMVLVYPGTDRTTEYRSHRLFGEGFALGLDDIAWFNAQYAPDADTTDPLVSPVRAPDLAGMPPALIVSAGFDPLRDEATAYASALEAAGTRVRQLQFESLIHGFVGLVGINQTSRLAVIEIARAMRAMLSM